MNLSTLERDLQNTGAIMLGRSTPEVAKVRTLAMMIPTRAKYHTMQHKSTEAMRLKLKQS